MFDPEKFGEAMGAAIRDAVAPLLQRIDLMEKDLEGMAAQLQNEIKAFNEAQPTPGPAGAPGKDAEPVDTGAIVKAVIAQLPVPTNGKDGQDGNNGTSVTLDDVRPILADAIKQIKEDAESVISAAAAAIPIPANGKDGINGRDGQRGEKGADGTGLAGAMIDRDGSLQVTFTNGEVKNLGPVVGRNGTDGKDGISFESFDLEYLPETHEVCVKASIAGRTKELRYPAGGIRPAGYWRDGTRAKAGEAWVHDGSMWIALKDCQSKPALNDDGWIIGARKGRDGERGRDFKAVDTAPIKLGN